MPKLEVADGDVQEAYYNFISLSIKKIIIQLEPQLKNNYPKMLNDDGSFFVNESLAVSGYYPDLRTNVSLPEILSGKLFPKGRAAWYRTRCEDYPEYKEAKKRINVLLASYTRTLKKLLKYGLVATNPFKAKTYYITEDGLSVLKKFRLLNTSEVSK